MRITVNRLLKDLTKLKEQGHGSKQVVWAGEMSTPLSDGAILGRYFDGSDDEMEPELVDEKMLKVLVEDGSVPKSKSKPNAVGIS